jgi:hypothetical protein
MKWLPGRDAVTGAAALGLMLVGFEVARQPFELVGPVGQGGQDWDLDVVLETPQQRCARRAGPCHSW